MADVTGDDANPADWLRAATAGVVVQELEGIYARCAEAIAARGPACWASGRCCNFEAAGHLLYVTGLEAAYTVARLDAAAWTGGPAKAETTEITIGGGARVLGGGAGADSAGGEKVAGGRTVGVSPAAAGRVLAAIGSGCVFQKANLCGAHTIKPLGCRIYFCDRSAQDWQQDVHEMLITDLRRLHERHGIEYRYGEWRSMLRQVLTHVAAG